MLTIKKMLHLALIPMILSLFIMGQLAFAADTATTEFKATIVGGTCDITVPSTVIINNGDPIPSEDISMGNSNEEDFNLILAGCNGYGLTPSITLEGDVVNDSGKDLFVSTTSTTKGYGILLSTLGNLNFKANENLATNKQISAQDKAWDSTMASTLNGTIPLKASVSCGDCIAGPELQGGELAATVTFKFIYN
nr:fimbrial protein [uncultured Moellerella sp.]